MRLIVGISGATGAIYGIRLLEVLQLVDDIETHLIITSVGEPFRLGGFVEPPCYRRHYLQRLFPHRWHGDRPMQHQDALWGR